MIKAMGINSIFIIVLLILLGLILGITYYFSLVLPKQDKRQARIQSMGYALHSSLDEAMPSKLIALKETQLEKRLNVFLKQDKSGYGFIRLQLVRSGLKYSLEKLVAIFVIAWVIGTARLYTFTELSLFLSILYGLGITSLIAYFLVKRFQNKRRDQIVDQLSPALDIILRGVRSGSQIDKTFHIVAREIPSPLKEEFEQMNSELDFGADFDKVLHASGLRVNSPDYYFFVTTLIIQRRTGGSLADVLENIIMTLNKTKELKMKVKVFSSEAKTSGYVLAALPVVAMLALLRIKPEYVEFFLYDPLGRKLLMTSIGLIITALITIRRMIKIEV